jgi:hypothetical protein
LLAEFGDVVLVGTADLFDQAVNAKAFHRPRDLAAGWFTQPSAQIFATHRSPAPVGFVEALKDGGQPLRIDDRIIIDEGNELGAARFQCRIPRSRQSGFGARDIFERREPGCEDPPNRPAGESGELPTTITPYDAGDSVCRDRLSALSLCCRSFGRCRRARGSVGGPEPGY